MKVKKHSNVSNVMPNLLKMNTLMHMLLLIMKVKSHLTVTDAMPALAEKGA